MIRRPPSGKRTRAPSPEEEGEGERRVPSKNQENWTVGSVMIAQGRVTGEEGRAVRFRVELTKDGGTTYEREREKGKGLGHISFVSKDL